MHMHTYIHASMHKYIQYMHAHVHTHTQVYRHADLLHIQ